MSKTAAATGPPVMSRLRRSLARAPLAGRAFVFSFRAWLALKLVARYAAQVARWLFASREFTNYTYHLTAHNRRELVEFIRLIAPADRGRIRGYLDEVLHDTGLQRAIAARVAANPHHRGADSAARLGKRIGWYALVRILKPRVVVESGVDKGLGTCVLAAALLRNEAEGAPGRAYALDIDPRAGWLLGPPYDRVVELKIADSHATLRDFSAPIDLFIHDSNHSYEHETGEYRIIAGRLREGAVVLSDNAHSCAALMDFAAATGNDYHFWPERPRDHFYPGGGIGAVVLNRRAGDPG